VSTVDEHNSPVDGADVVITSILQAEWNEQPKLESRQILTGADGTASATLPAAGSVTFKVSKDKYYDAEGKYDFQKLSEADWEPQPIMIKTVLRPIGKQIPMYARVVSVDIDTREGERGIDLNSGVVGPRNPGSLQIIVSGSKSEPSGPTMHFDETLSRVRVHF
jgi:hypothetical protein